MLQLYTTPTQLPTREDIFLLVHSQIKSKWFSSLITWSTEKFLMSFTTKSTLQSLRVARAPFLSLRTTTPIILFAYTRFGLQTAYSLHLLPYQIEREILKSR